MRPTSTILPSLSGRDTEVAQPASEGGALYLESVRQRLAGHRDAAYELLVECLRLNPDMSEALYDMANLKLSASALIDSLTVAEGDSLLRRAYAVDTTNTDIRQRLAQHLLYRGDYAEATRLYERICAGRRPKYGEMGTLIQLYEIQAQYPKALSAVQRMETLEGPDAVTAWERYQIYQCMGEREQAEHTYDSLLVKAMPDPSTPDFVREQLQRQPRYYDKVRALRDSLISAIETQDGLLIGRLCREGQLYEPDFLHYYYYEALSHLQQNHTEEALEACQRGFNRIDTERISVLDASQRDMCVELYSFAGDLYTNTGNIEAALEAYELAISLDSTRLYVLNNYAYQLAELGRDLDRAAQLSRLTVEAEPDNATFLDTYAWILYRQRCYREAREYIERAQRLLQEEDEDVTAHRKAIEEKLRNKK
ncbi:MAG: hypothetical protein MJZ40_05590 [Bacteroidaceae bacterium]|nr:hypothetical protein [Bacteroidaceae bacterium]